MWKDKTDMIVSRNMQETAATLRLPLTKERVIQNNSCVGGVRNVPCRNATASFHLAASVSTNEKSSSFSTGAACLHGRLHCFTYGKGELKHSLLCMNVVAYMRLVLWRGSTEYQQTRIHYRCSHPSRFYTMTDARDVAKRIGLFFERPFKVFFYLTRNRLKTRSMNGNMGFAQYSSRLPPHQYLSLNHTPIPTQMWRCTSYLL